MGLFDKLRGKTDAHAAGTKHTGHGPPPPGMVVDPVCKMWVDPNHPPGGSSAHGSQTFHFCSPGCKRSFEADPHRYLGHHAH